MTLCPLSALALAPASSKALREQGLVSPHAPVPGQ